jgi:hypothetical protein
MSDLSSLRARRTPRAFWTRTQAGAGIPVGTQLRTPLLHGTSLCAQCHRPRGPCGLAPSSSRDPQDPRVGDHGCERHRPSPASATLAVSSAATWTTLPSVTALTSANLRPIRDRDRKPDQLPSKDEVADSEPPLGAEVRAVPGRRPRGRRQRRARHRFDEKHLLVCNQTCGLLASGCTGDPGGVRRVFQLCAPVPPQLRRALPRRPDAGLPHGVPRGTTSARRAARGRRAADRLSGAVLARTPRTYDDRQVVATDGSMPARTGSGGRSALHG